MHRRAMVNVAYVDEIYPDVDGGMLVRLKDEKKTEAKKDDKKADKKDEKKK